MIKVIQMNKKKNTSSNANNDIQKIKDVLATLRPYLNMDGGDVEFISYVDKIVYVKLTGACQACLFSDETIKNGLYESIKAEVPEIEGVINVEL